MARKNQSRLRHRSAEARNKSLPVSNKVSGKKLNTCSTVRVEALEERVMFSADPFGTGIVEWGADNSLDDANDQTFWTTAPTSTTELIFIDSTVPQRQILIDDLQQQIGNGRTAQIILLQPEDDGLQTITNTLGDFSAISSIQIISHGNDHGIRIGETWLSNDVAIENTSLLNQWQSSLTDSADLLIYGCNLAASEAGLSLLNTLASATQADVAASADNTGHQNLGANWTLEHASGRLESDIHLSEEARLAWEHELSVILLEAYDDNVGPVAHNLPIVLGDNAIADSDLTQNDTIVTDPDNTGQIHLVNLHSANNGSFTENADDTFTFSPATDPDNDESASVRYIISNGDDILHHWPLERIISVPGFDVVESETSRGAGFIRGADIATDSTDGTSYLNFDNPGFQKEIWIPEIDLPDTFTLSFEYRLDGNSGLEQFVDLGDAYSIFNSDPGSIGIWYENSEIVTVIKGENDNQQLETRVSVDPANNDWHTYTLTIDNTTQDPDVHVYLDGVELGSGNAGLGGFNAKELFLAVFNDSILNATPLKEHHMRDVRIYEGVTVPVAADHLQEPLLYSTATATFSVLSENAQPDLITGTSTSSTYIESHSPIVLSSTISVTDADIQSGDNYDGATIHLVRDTGANTDDVFDLQPGALLDTNDAPIGAITTNSGGELLITFNSLATTDLVNETLQSITYKNLSTHPEDQIALTWTYDDGTTIGLGTTTQDSETTTVDLVRTPNITVDSSSNITIPEDDTLPVTFDVNFTHDIDDPNIRFRATVKADNGTLTAAGGSASVDGSGTNLLTVTGTETAVKATLDFLEYVPNQHYHGSDTLIINIDVAKSADIHDVTWQQQPSGTQPIFDETIRGLKLENGDYLTRSYVDPSQELTLSAWVNLDTIGANNDGSGAELFTINDNVGLRLDYTNESNDNLGLTGYFFDGSAWLETNSPDNQDTVLQGKGWQHVAYVIVNGYQGIFINGAEVATTTYSATNSAPLINYNSGTQVRIGAHFDNSSTQYQFNGSVDDAAIHARALAAAEITAMAQRTSPFAGGTSTTPITINPVNDAPTLSNSTNNSTNISIAENASGTPQNAVLEADIEITDIEAIHATDSKNYNKATLTLERSYEDQTATGTGSSAGANADDVYASNLFGNLTQGTDLPFATVLKNSDGTLRIQFDENATKANIDALMRSITYSNQSQWPHELVKLTWTFDDNGNDNYGNSVPANSLQSTLTTTVGITPFNQNPIVSTNNPLFLESGSSEYISTLLLQSTDPDHATSDLTYRIASEPTAGTLIVNGTVYNHASGPKPTFTQEDIDNNRIEFIANNQNSGVTGGFDFEVQDTRGGTDNGTFEIELALDVNDINASPAGEDNTLVTYEDIPINLQEADFGYSDLSEGDRFSAVTVTTLPTSGTLTLAGTPVTAGQLVSITDINNSDLIFTPSPNEHGTDYAKFDFQVHDDGGTANGGIDQDQTPNTITFDVNGINDPPAGSDSALSVNEDSQITLIPNHFGFSDSIDGHFFAAITVVRLPNAGTLALAGNPVNTGQLISIANISSGELTYTPPANENGPAYTDFQFKVHDNGGTANGGIDQDQTANTIAFNINSINDAPTGADNTLTTDEDTAITLRTADFGFSDPIDGNLFSAVSITTLPGNGSLTLNGSTINAGHLINTTDIVAGTLVFTPSANENGVGYANFQFQVHDDGGTANGGTDRDQSANTITIDVNSVNDAPFGTDNTLTANEDAAITLQPADFGFSDPIDNDFFAAVTFTGLPSKGTLTLANAPLTTGQTVSITKINNGELVYTPVANQHGNAYDNLEFRVHDNGNIANGGIDQDPTANTITFDINSANDAPIGTDNTLTTNEDTAIALQIADFGFSDPVDGNLFSAVTIATLPSNGVLTLATIPVTAGQLVSISDINNDDLFFTPAANQNGASYDYFDFQVHDDGGTVNDGQDQDPTANKITFHVKSINDAPKGVDNTLATNEDTPLILQSVDFGFSDLIDSDTLSAVTVSTLPNNGSLNLNGMVVTAGQKIDITNIENGELVYTPSDNDNGTGYTDFYFQVHDNGGTNNGGIDQDQTPNALTIDVAQVNDRPSGTDNTLIATEDTPLIISSSDFGYSDPIDQDNFAALTITDLPAKGTLSLGDSLVMADQTISIARINNDELIFYPANNASGSAYTEFGFKVHDDGGTINGGIDQDQTANKITIDLLSVNDAPTGTNHTLTVHEDTSLSIMPVDFGFSDLADGDNFAAVSIATLPVNGSLTLNSVAVTADQIIEITEFDGGELVFTPESNANGARYAFLGFQVQDDGGTAYNGIDKDQQEKRINIDALSVNDPPGASDAQIDGIEDTVITFSADNFGFYDIDGNNFQSVVIDSVPLYGDLKLYDQSVSIGSIIDATELQSLTYTPPLDANGASYDTFDFRVRDGGGVVNDGQNTSLISNRIIVNINPVNDTPSGTDNALSTLEDTALTFTAGDFGFSDTDGDSFENLILQSIPTGAMLLAGTQVTAGQTIPAGELDNLVYFPPPDAEGDAFESFTFLVVDSGATTNNGDNTSSSPNTIEFDIDSVNDAPSATDKTISIEEDTSYVIETADFGFTDPVDNDSFSAVTVLQTSLYGNLQLDGVTVTPNTVINAQDIALGKLTYTPPPDAHSISLDEVHFNVLDDGGTENQGQNISSDINKLTFNVSSVNDAPSGIDRIVSTLEDTPYVLTRADFGFNDADNNNFSAVVITSLPAHGSLLLDATALSVATKIQLSDIDAGALTFTPAANESGLNYSHFSFAVTDDGGTASNGHDTDESPNLLTIDVLPVNDAPVSSDTIADVPDNLEYTLSSADFDFYDTENHSLLAIRIDTLPSSGILTLQGQPVTIGEIVDIGSINQGLLVFSPAQDSGISTSRFEYSVIDSGGIENYGQNTSEPPVDLTFNMVSINDAPLVNAEVLQVAEGQIVSQTTDNANSLLTNDSDADGDNLIARLVKAPDHGEFELFTDGTFHYIHNGSETLTDEVIYSVSDGSLAVESTVIIHITPVNDAPIAGNMGKAVTTVSEEFSLVLPENHFTDPDPGDALEVIATLADGSPLPEWLSFNPSTMTFSGTPMNTQELTISLIATDQQGLLARSTFTVSVEPKIQTALMRPVVTPVPIAPIVMDIEEKSQEVNSSEQPDSETAQETTSEKENAFQSLAETTTDLADTLTKDSNLEVASLSTKAAIFRDFDLLSRSIETHRGFSVSSLTNNESPIELQESRGLADLLYSDDERILSNTTLLNQLNEQRDQMQQSIVLNGNVISGAVSVSTGLSIGYVIWLVRGGLLLGSVLSSLPAWRNIDPLPVLSTLSGDDKDETDHSLEDLVVQDGDTPDLGWGSDERQ